MCHTFSVMLYNKFDMLIVFGGAKYNIIVWYCFCCWSHIMLNKWLEHGASSKPVLCAQTFVYFNVHGNGTCKMYYRVCTQHNTDTTREFIYIYVFMNISYRCMCVCVYLAESHCCSRSTLSSVWFSSLYIIIIYILHSMVVVSFCYYA